MNITEQKAYQWLLKKKGYKEQEIVFQSRKSPDFITADGYGYEIKLLYNKVVWFNKPQLELLQHMPNVFLVIFARDKDEPIIVIPTVDIYENAVVQGIKIVIPTSNKEAVTLSLDPEVVAVVHDMTEKGVFNLSRWVNSTLREKYREDLKNSKK